MKTFYFFNVIGNIHSVSIGILIFLIITAIISPSVSISLMNDSDVYESDSEIMGRCIKFLKKLIIPFIITIFAVIFIPTKKEMYMIYGCGAVLDYLNSSEEAKQLPDKTIKMLNEIAEKYVQDDKE